MDEQLRDLGHAARAEAEAATDVDRAWTSLSDEIATGTRMAAITESGGWAGRSPWPWLAVAATFVAAVAGLVLLGGDDDDAIQITDVPNTTRPVVTPSSPGTAPDATVDTAQQPSTTAPPATTIGTTIAPTTSVESTLTTLGSTGVPTVSWRDLEWEGSRISRTCVRDFDCTQLRIAPDGTTVSYDPAERVLTRHSTPPVTAAMPDTYGPVWIELVGPDDVVYLNVDPTVPDGDGVGADLVAVSLAPGDAGREIDRWAGVADRIGDSDLVATREGIVWVGCCGPDTVRPAPDAPTEVRWVARDGGDLPDTSGWELSANISVVLEYPSTTFRRDTLSWTVESNDGGRGMPVVVPTFDGGIIARLDGQDGNTTVVRGWADGRVAQIRFATLDERVVLVEPTGTAVIENGDRFVRVRPFADRAERWNGNLDLDLSDWSVSATGLNELLDAQAPSWETDPVAFADAITGAPAVHETRSVRLLADDGTSVLVEVITANYFDDSVFAGRHSLTLERRPDGALRFVSGEFANACQPNRGHQELAAELCV